MPCSWERPACCCFAASLALCACGGEGQADHGKLAGDLADSRPSVIFVDRSAEAGVRFHHSHGASGRFLMPEIAGAGGALFDYDRDGDLDLYAVQGGSLIGERDSTLTDRLFRNELISGDSPSGGLHFVDVSAAAGIVEHGYGMGAATGDVDNDGFLDLYVTNYGPNQLWHNRGDGTFEDWTERSGTGDPSWSTSAAFFDLDRDGSVDLYVANYLRFRPSQPKTCRAPSGQPDYCGPLAYPPAGDRVYRNRGDGTFEDVTLALGVGALPANGLGVLEGDFDGDGWIDVYVANDQMENQLWRNLEGIRFQNVARSAGVAVNGRGRPTASMGIAAGDADNDGDEDLLITNLNGETNTFYRNLGQGVFEDASLVSGLGPPSRGYTGFGVAFLDYDNDGWLDVLVANGAVYRHDGYVAEGPMPYGQANQLYHNRGDGTFVEVSAEAGPDLARLLTSRGLASGDLDNDGDTDAVVWNDHGPLELLVNLVGQDRDWLGLELQDRAGRPAVGAWITVIRERGPAIVRRVRTASSYGSASDSRILVGLGGRSGNAPASAEVTWPDGSREVWEALSSGRYHTLVQGSGRVLR